MDTRDFIEKHKLIVVCRKIYDDELKRLAAALFKGGVRLMEVTLDQRDPDCISKTSRAIRMLNELYGDALLVGAGTVLNEGQVDVAFQAGAKYIVSPNYHPGVIKRTKELGLVSIPGGMTPTEILAAHDCGADFVKLFPATTLGFKYIQDILAPISHVKLIATAGVNEENFRQYLDLGFVGAGVSGRLTDRKLIAIGDFEELTRRAEVFCSIARGE
ncbi:MAG: bifunctional 4-hydroxy-2-oxoglutarate aldolase/2-dehydro-3-deoxy-phosphogluconate aldolase [Chloroflexi bacterium]|nr:bifunctional 4-hydroxy-2-oxoglutarate aldolase/2-dehydro-3-deoxy-phosphogluconate aldolase [Chloroflexota bacterium]